MDPGPGPWALGPMGPRAQGPWALGPLGGPKIWKIENHKIDFRLRKKSTDLPEHADRSVSSSRYDSSGYDANAEKCQKVSKSSKIQFHQQFIAYFSLEGPYFSFKGPVTGISRGIVNITSSARGLSMGLWARFLTAQAPGPWHDTSTACMAQQVAKWRGMV